MKSLQYYYLMADPGDGEHVSPPPRINLVNNYSKYMYHPDPVKVTQSNEPVSKNM